MRDVGDGSRRLGERLREGRRRAFVGRAAELAAFRAALAGEPGAGAVLYLHGHGGVGKSTLLRRFADDARAAGRPVVAVDGAAIDPTPAAFEAEAARALADHAETAEAARALADHAETAEAARAPADHTERAGAARPVLLVDGFEHVQGLEGWLRDRFLPRLSDGAVVVIAGQLAPDPRWTSDLAWSELLRVREVGDFSPEEAAGLLVRRDVPAHLHESILEFTGGHPLALSLAAAVAVRERDAARWTPGPDTLTTLVEGFAGSTPSAAHRTALAVLAHAPATSEELLRAVVGEQATGLFDWLRALPFAESHAHGLTAHRIVREAVDSHFKWRDPQGYAALHRAIVIHLADRARRGGKAEVVSAVRSLYRLIGAGDTAMAREMRSSHEGSFYVETAGPQDRAAVAELARSDGAEAAALAEFWLARQPEAFRVFRHSADKTVAATGAALLLTGPDPEEVAADPFVAALWREVGARVPRTGERVCLSCLHHPLTGRAEGVDGLLRLTIAEDWLLTDRVAWSFLVLPSGNTLGPVLELAGFPRVGAPLRFGTTDFELYAHSWRDMPHDAWISLLSDLALHGPGARTELRRPEGAALNRTDFDTAVRDALRSWHNRPAFAANPLLTTRLAAAEPGEEPEAVVQRLRDLLVEAVDTLREDPRETKMHRALATTYFHRVPTQDAAAERLGLPFSTYRRHLTRGLDRVADLLWDRRSAR